MRARAAFACARTFISMCLRPITMFDLGINAVTGKRKLVAKRPNNSPLFSFPEILVPCGKCSGCLQAKRLDWCNRLQVELKSSPSATFVTLTYNDEHLPAGNRPVKKHIQDFLKRFRNIPRDYGVLFDSPLRYFFASEHGALNNRIHYHGILYGVDLFSSVYKPLLHHFDRDNFPVYISPILAKLWPYGFSSIGKCTKDSIKYISDYIYGDDDCRLFSCGLGVPFFCDYGFNERNRYVPIGLKPIARQAARNAFITLGPLDNLKKCPPPKFLSRYLEKFDSALFDHYSNLRRGFARNAAKMLPHLFEEHILTVSKGKLRKKKL